MKRVRSRTKLKWLYGGGVALLLGNIVFAAAPATSALGTARSLFGAMAIQLPFFIVVSISVLIYLAIYLARMESRREDGRNALSLIRQWLAVIVPASSLIAAITAGVVTYNSFRASYRLSIVPVLPVLQGRLADINNFIGETDGTVDSALSWKDYVDRGQTIIPAGPGDYSTGKRLLGFPSHGTTVSRELSLAISTDVIAARQQCYEIAATFGDQVQAIRREYGSPDRTIAPAQLKLMKSTIDALNDAKKHFDLLANVYREQTEARINGLRDEVLQVD